MTGFNFTYKFLGIYPVTRRKKIPESFEEVSMSFLIWWMKAIHSRLEKLQEKEAEESDEVEIAALMILACKKVLKLPVWLFWMLTPEQLHQLVFQEKVANFLFEPFKRKANPILRLGKFYGPAVIDRLSGYEFAFVDVMFLRWHKSKSKEDLVTFVSHLYRGKSKNYNPLRHDTNGDIREPYNNLTAKNRVTALRNQSEEKLLLVALWYQAWRLSLPKTYKELFSEENEKKASGNGNWLQIIIQSSGGLANYENVRQLPAVLILAEVNNMCRQVREMEERLNAKP